MSYSTENAKDNVARNMLVVLKPRIRVSTWTLDSGSVYYNDFSFGYVTAVAANGSSLSAGSSSSLAAGEYYFDADLGRLYVRMSDSGAPDATDWFVVTFEVYLATQEIYWYRTPTDNTSRVVHWRGLITRSPQVVRSITDSIFGFAPIQTTSVEFVNDSEYFEEFLYGMTLSRSEIVVYHVAGMLSTANIQKLFTGIGENFSYDDKSIRVAILDKSYLFDEQMDNGAAISEWPLTLGGNAVDSQFYGKGIPSIYGMARGVRGVSIDFYAGQDSNSNHVWAFCTNGWGTNYWAPTVTAYTATTRTVSLYDARCIKKAFDCGFIACFLDTGIFGTISDVNTATGVITHSNDLSGGASSQFKLVPYAQIKLLQGETAFDYDAISSYDSANGVCSVTLNAVTSVGGTDPAEIDGSVDYVIANVLGPLIAPTIGGSKFGDCFNPVTVLYHILKDRLGLAETEIDTDAFSTVASAINHSFCFNVIEDEGDQPKYRDVINKILLSSLLRAYINEDGKFTISQVGPAAGTADLTVYDDDIIGAPGWNADLRDIAEIEYRSQRVAYFPLMTNGSTSGHAVKYVLANDHFEDSLDTEHEAYTYLHGVTRTRRIETYNEFVSTGEDTPTVLATRYAQIFGDRRQLLEVFIKTGAHGLDIGDTVQIDRLKQPGFEFDGSTLQSRKYVIVEIRKEIGGVFLVLDDQKAIEENTGDW